MNDQETHMDQPASVLRTSVGLLRRARAVMVAVVAALLILLAAVEPAAGQGRIEEAKLTASDGALEEDFGWAVALSGERVLIGAPKKHDVRGAHIGAAYIFELSGDGWTEIAQLTASDAAPDDDFGLAVALDGDRALVGEPLWYWDGRDAGSAYIFELSDDGWTEIARLTASDVARKSRFGLSVTLEGNHALVGAPFDDHAAGRIAGSAYIFELSGGDWTEVAKLTAADAATEDTFGWSLALDGDRALVAAPGDNGNTGSVYVFELLGGVWTQTAKLVARDSARGDRFGHSVNLDGNLALIGANLDDHAGGRDAGSAYIFELSGGAWIEVAKLTASDAAPEESFGSTVAVDDDLALVGVLDSDDGPFSGSVFVFERIGGTWLEVAKLTATDSATGNYFGFSVALDENRALVGTPGSVQCTGAAYIFSGPGGMEGPLSPKFLRGDVDDDGTVQLTDAVRILDFLFAGAAEPPCLETADTDDNGAIQVTDAVRILTFLFAGGIELPPPGPKACGTDPVDSPHLSCVSYTNC